MSSEWCFPNRATPAGSTLYYAIRLAPSSLRDALASVAAWRHEVQSILTDVSDPGVARLKLDWWRDELARTVDGTPRHPLSRALAPLLAERPLRIEPFLAIAEHVEAELRRQTPSDRLAWQEAEVRDRGALFELLARCHGVTEQTALGRARELGGFCGQVYRLRDAGLLLRAGRAVISGEQLAAAGLTDASLTAPSRAQQLPKALAMVGSEVRAYRAATDDSELPLCLRIQARILDALHDELSATGYAVADQRIGLTPLRKLWLAWRETRRRQPSPEPTPDPRGS